ncbi:MAG: LysR family transcriptional regulator, partial [Bdellovibrionales bacterium]|nr:LysR family transcriptional regulator [Bdellovibrionales bacterium]
LDLNLLVALEQLIELRNVSRAAEKLNVTQPAMSNILSRLRQSLNDDLLVKSGREMILTPKAKDIFGPLKKIMHAIQTDILDSKKFDPFTDPFHFKLAFHDYEQLVIHTKILPVLLKQSPQISIEHISPRSMHPTEDLGSGTVDFSTGPIIHEGSGIMRKKLFSDRFVCLADRKNKILKNKKLTPNLYASMEHIFIAPHGGRTGLADDLLQKKKLKRFVRISVAQFSITPWLLLNTDLIVTLPYLAADIFASQHKDLVLHECPLKLDPVDIYLSWHERLNNSPPHLWLRELVSREIFRERR